MFLKILNIKLNKITTTYINFSNKKSLNFLEKKSLTTNKNSFIKIKKIKKQQITFLRAPKHFKIGRHHIQTLKRIIYVTTCFNTQIDCLNLNLLHKFLSNVNKLVPQHPITKTNKIKAEIFLNFKIV